MVTVSLLFSGLALADPVALRLGEGAVGLAGAPVVGAALPVSEAWSLAASHRLRSSVDVSAGTRWVLAADGASRGWELGTSGGVVLPLWDPALAVSVTGYAHRWRTLQRSTLRGGLAVPAAVQLTGGAAARLPILGELTLARDVGAVRIGLYGGGGVTLGGGWALGGQAGLVIGQATGR